MSKVVVFDLDDTIIPSTRIYKLVISQFEEVPAEQFQAARGRVKDFLPRNHVVARNRLLYLKSFSEMSGMFEPSEILKLQEKYENLLFSEIERFWLGTNRQKLFESLCAAYDVYILTNENLRTQLIKLSALGSRFASCMKGLLTSEEAGVEKPSLEIYHKFISRFGLSTRLPETITMVGDNFQHDIEPALAMGWSAIKTTEFADCAISFGSAVESGNARYSIYSSLHTIVQELLRRA